MTTPHIPPDIHTPQRRLPAPLRPAWSQPSCLCKWLLGFWSNLSSLSQFHWRRSLMSPAWTINITKRDPGNTDLSCPPAPPSLQCSLPASTHTHQSLRSYEAQAWQRGLFTSDRAMEGQRDRGQGVPEPWPTVSVSGSNASQILATSISGALSPLSPCEYALKSNIETGRSVASTPRMSGVQGHPHHQGSPPEEVDTGKSLHSRV